MNAVQVRLFATYAELFGADTVEVLLTDDASVADLTRELRRLPGGASLPLYPLVAVNLRQARPDQAVRPGDELAVLPPLAGG